MLYENKILRPANQYAAKLSIVAIFLLTAFCCRQPVNNTKQARFDSVLVKIDSSVKSNNFKYTEKDMALLDAAYASLKKPADSNTANKNYRKLFYYAESRSDYATAILYADSNIALLQNGAANDELSHLYINTLFEKGDIYYRLKNYDEAILNYTAAKARLASGKMDSSLLYNYYKCAANILYSQKKYLQAADFFKMKYQNAANCIKVPLMVFLEVQENLDNVGICYTKCGLADSAIYYFNAALDYINQNEKKIAGTKPGNFELDRMVVYSNLADALYLQKDMAGAEKLLLKTIDYFKNLKEFAFIQPMQLLLAKIYIETNDTQNAGKVLNDSVLLAAAGTISSEACSYYKLLSGYYTKINQAFKANTALLQAYNISDSLEKKNLQLNAVDLRREFESREQNTANEALNKDNKIKSGYLLIAVMSTVLGIIVIFLIWNNLKRKSRFVKNLTFLNEAISRKNEDLQRTFTSLEQSHKENNRMVRIMAHDLKNPISSIHTLAHSLLKTEPPGEKKESLSLIRATCKESIALINDLLNNKRSLQDISKELVDMGRLIEQCAELFQVKAEEKNQRITLHVEHPVIMLNRQKIWRVVSNIVNNAIKFSPLNAEIMVQLQTKEETVLLSVQDNGIGIPAELKEKIFTIDPLVSRAGTAGEESYGLGLSISKKIIEEHAGQLWFESEAGKGSVFYVELPYSAN
ncbi:MAG: HAMP domain-containing sensor histidine kinase [Chitinophagaceae bacterium]